MRGVAAKAIYFPRVDTARPRATYAAGRQPAAVSSGWRASSGTILRPPRQNCGHHGRGSRPDRVERAAQTCLNFPGWVASIEDRTVRVVDDCQSPAGRPRVWRPVPALSPAAPLNRGRGYSGAEQFGSRAPLVKSTIASALPARACICSGSIFSLSAPLCFALAQYHHAPVRTARPGLWAVASSVAVNTI